MKDEIDNPKELPTAWVACHQTRTFIYNFESTETRDQWLAVGKDFGLMGRPINVDEKHSTFQIVEDVQISGDKGIRLTIRNYVCVVLDRAHNLDDLLTVTTKAKCVREE